MEVNNKSPFVLSRAEGSSHLSGHIHPTAILGANVKVGENVFIGPYVVITGTVTIGSGTKIYSHVSIGYPAQDTGITDSLGTIEIGNNCTIREFVTISASKKADGETTIGDNCYIMSYSHIAHDVTLEYSVVLINNVQLGGHTYIERKAFLMAHAATHQSCRVGQFTAIAPYSGTRQDLPPFCLFDGRPGHFAGLNRIALIRASFSNESLEALNHVTFLFYQKKLLLDEITDHAKQATWGNDLHVQSFITFIKESNRGVSRKTITEKRNENSYHQPHSTG